MRLLLRRGSQSYNVFSWDVLHLAANDTRERNVKKRKERRKEKLRMVVWNVAKRWRERLARLDRTSPRGDGLRALSPDWLDEKLLELSFYPIMDALAEARLLPNWNVRWGDQPEEFCFLWSGVKPPYAPSAYLRDLWPGWERDTFGRRLSAFLECVDQIQDQRIREATRAVLRAAPLQFWVGPASSTGKHHLPEQNYMGGLLYHCLELAKPSDHFIRMFPQMTERRGRKVHSEWMDGLLAVVLTHDSWKGWVYGGWGRHTQAHHPFLSALAWGEIGPQYGVDEIHMPLGSRGCSDISALIVIVEALYLHSGRWTPEVRNTLDDSLDEMTPLGLLVHTLDMISAARRVIVDIGVP